MLEPEPLTFQVTDLKQYVYCPRILYYHTVLPQVRPLTYKMETGIAAHREAEGREKRRSLRTYGLGKGQRHFNVPLYAAVAGLPTAPLALTGEVDMVIETETELIPIDFKNARREGPHFRLQLMAYGRMLELADPKSLLAVRRGFLYLIPARKAVEVRFTPRLRRQLDAALETMRVIATTQHVPAPTKQRGRCVDCEFRRFCNDIL
jgi:CRISPR-associated exonuclease Cas4